MEGTPPGPVRHTKQATVVLKSGLKTTLSTQTQLSADNTCSPCACTKCDPLCVCDPPGFLGIATQALLIRNAPHTMCALAGGGDDDDDSKVRQRQALRANQLSGRYPCPRASELSRAGSRAAGRADDAPMSVAWLHLLEPSQRPSGTGAPSPLRRNVNWWCAFVELTRDGAQHMLTHTGERPHRCNWKGADRTQAFQQVQPATYTSWVHVTHQPRATGCNYAAARRATLDEHKRTHTGLKPYSCTWPRCQYAAAQKTTLLTHYRRHERYVGYLTLIISITLTTCNSAAPESYIVNFLYCRQVGRQSQQSFPCTRVMPGLSIW